MTKKKFLLKQIAKTNKKNFENYVVTRIIHGVDDLEVKFITQQYIRRPGGYALVDLYLPQLKLYVEVKEYYHQQPSVEISDKARKADIVRAADLEEEVIVESDKLQEINKAIDDLVNKIKQMVHSQRSNVSFKPWDPEYDSSPARYIEQGYMDAQDDVSFRLHVDACNCFGHQYIQHCSGGAKHRIEDNIMIWFPKLYKNQSWDNSISDDDNTILEKFAVNNDKHIRQVLELDQEEFKKRIVFAHVQSPLGDVMYRFKGLYKINIEKSKVNNAVTFDRIASRVKTYSPVKQ